MSEKQFNQTLNCLENADKATQNEHEKQLAQAIGHLALAIQESHTELTQKLDKLIQRQSGH